jgi:hypothetical protein
MSDIGVLRDLLVDSFTRVHELVEEATDGLTEEDATFRPDAEANSAAWLIWHLSRVQDDHVAELAQVEQVWPAWRDQFGLPFAGDATGYGQSPAEVAELRVGSELLAGYHRDVHALCLRYVQEVSAEELQRVVDERWDPPVTASARLVSVLGDALQHLGQVGYVLGLAERAREAAR